MVKVFVDGSAGTTGLEIVARLADRRDITLSLLPEAHRKDRSARAEALAAADIAILCLPDDAAREAVAIAVEGRVRFIDASTAHRTDPGWTYGFPELAPGQRAAIRAARFVSNPGCYPTGFLVLVAPLVRGGLLPAAAAVTVHAVSGYSGGGKAMIEAFEQAGAAADAYRTYGLSLDHKHVPEMQRHAGLARPPLFTPAVVRTHRGMIVEVPLHLAHCAAGASVERIHAALADAYAGEPLVSVAPIAGDAGRATLAIGEAPAGDGLALHVFANPRAGHVRLVATLDNLGKGASGAAVQNLNLMAGLPELEGLRV